MFEMIGGWIWSALSSLFSAGTNIYQAKRNRDFQKDMSNTAHQREIMDLRAAGLNPILSVSRGGASTPGGSQARVDSLNESVNSAITYRMMKAQVDKLNAEAKKTEQETRIMKKHVPISDVVYDFLNRYMEPTYRNSARDVPPIEKAYNKTRDAIQSPFVPYLNTKHKRKPWYMKSKKKESSYWDH